MFGKNSAKTIELFEEFIKKYPRLPGKRVAVAQGLLLRILEIVTKL